MTVDKHIEAPAKTVEKASNSGDTCSTSLSIFENLALAWEEKDQLPVLVLRAICRLAEEQPENVEQGFTSVEIVAKVGQIRGNSWHFSETESRKISTNWKRLRVIQEKKRAGIIQHMETKGFDTFPHIDMVNKGGGSGHETRYSIVWRRFDEEPDIDEVLSRSSIRTGVLPEGWIQYVCEDVEGISKYLAKGWRIQLIIVMALLAIIFVLYYGGFALTLIFDRENTSQIFQLLSSGIILAALIWAFFGHLLTLQSKRIVPLPSIFQSLDNNHLIELKASKDKAKQPKLVRYSGECPICKGRVIAKSGGLAFFGRIVGKCENAPVEHIFSFDHVTRRGKPLR